MNSSRGMNREDIINLLSYFVKHLQFNHHVMIVKMKKFFEQVPCGSAYMGNWGLCLWGLCHMGIHPEFINILMTMFY